MKSYLCGAWIVVIAGLFLSWESQASGGGVVEHVLDVETSKGGAAGQREAFEKAIEKASLELIDQMIGEPRRIKSASLIKSRILKNSGKYILLIKGKGFRTKNGGGEYTVQMKVSVPSLEALLLQEGLLYRSDGPPRILPLVSVIDRVESRSLSWWSEGSGGDKALLKELGDKIHSGFKEEFRSRGFYVANPMGSALKGLVPTSLQRDNLGSEDLLFLARLLGAQVVLRGTVVISPQPGRSDAYRIQMKLSALHANNGRVIGEVSRVYGTDSGSLNAVVASKFNEVGVKALGDFATQVHDVWRSGIFGASLLSLDFKGDLNPKQLDALKSQMLAQFKELKNLKERLFENGRVVFESDTIASAQQLADRIQQAKFKGFQLKVSDVTSSGVSMRVEAR